MEGSLKNPIFRGVHEKPVYRGGDCLKEGRWTVFRFKRGLGEKEGLVFLRGEGGLWVNIFYQVLYGNFWKYEMLDGEIVNISRIINGWNMKFFKYLWNRKSCKA